MADAADRLPAPYPRGRLWELLLVFGRLGFTAFGGPAAHISMMHDEVVTRRRWLDDRAFLDLVAATNLIPGPNSTELAIHLGRLRAGWKGLLVAGAAFIAPAVAIVLVLAWAYVEYGTTPTAEALLYGISPVVIAIVAQALWKLAPTAAEDLLTRIVALGAFVLYLVGVHELVLLLVAGLVVLAVRNAGRLRSGAGSVVAVGLLPGLVPQAANATADATLLRLFLTFLKIGSVLYGSGYVLLAFLRTDLVERLGWLTEQQLLDAVAIGQFTPGPLFTTATFVGYVVLGVPGAIVATLGIFLPSFAFVAATAPILPRLRRSPWFGAALDGVVAASFALMAGVLVDLTRAAVVDVPAGAIAVVALVALVRFRVNSAWLVLAGGLAGLAIDAVR
jgi:chromate transporter